MIEDQKQINIEADVLSDVEGHGMFKDVPGKDVPGKDVPGKDILGKDILKDVPGREV